MRKLNDYSGYDVHSFAADEHFQDWVLHGSNDAYWQQVIALNPGRYEEIKNARILLASLKFREERPSGEGIEIYLKAALEKIATKDKRGPVILMRKWWLAAASIIMLIGIGLGVYTLMKHTATQQPVAKTTPSDIQAPATNRAMITLADGSKVFLDSLQNGAVATQGNIQVVKLSNGQIAYNPTSPVTDHRSPISYNTLTNPRGSKVIDMKLSDGTHVWLNAGSSITYPVAFVGDQRKVTLTGEGYFEVAHDAKKPFHVQAGEMDVKVLGTHFNVNAYKDEGAIKTTLLEGSVKVSAGKADVTLKPGQQATWQVYSHELQKRSGVNVDEVMAWKNGKFFFPDADIKAVMLQLARWYNFNIEFSGEIKGRFHVEMTRNTNVSNVFKILEATGGVRFKIESDKILVMPQN